MTLRMTLLAAAVLAGCAHPPRVARAPPPSTPHVKVTTYNLNYGLAGDEATLRAIGEGDPDLVLLQETSEAWEPHIRRAWTRRYPFMKFRHCCGAGGLAVLSKRPFEERGYLDGPDGSWFPALLIVADSSMGKLQVLVVHLHPPATNDGNFVKGYFTTDAIREAEMKTFFAQLDPDLPTLVAGDFNEPDGDAVRFLQDQGLRSGLPEFAPGAKTWRWKLPVGAMSSRLDHIFYDARLDPLSVEVLQAGRSDHLPVVGVFQRAAAAAPLEVQRSSGSLSFSP